MSNRAPRHLGVIAEPPEPISTPQQSASVPLHAEAPFQAPMTGFRPIPAPRPTSSSTHFLPQEW